MLFERIPLIYGSGVIPIQYVAIRETVKDTIMTTFFDPAFLEQYIGNKLKDVSGEFDPVEQVKKMLDSSEFEETLDEKLKDLAKAPAFQPMLAMGIQASSLKSIVKPFINDLGTGAAPILLDKLTDPAVIVDIDIVRNEIEECRCMCCSPVVLRLDSHQRLQL